MLTSLVFHSLDSSHKNFTKLKKSLDKKMLIVTKMAAVTSRAKDVVEEKRFGLVWFSHRRQSQCLKHENPLKSDVFD